MSDGVQGTVGSIGDYWTTVDTSNRLCYYTDQEHPVFEQVSKCTAHSVVLEQMLLEWAVATCHLPRNLAHVHPLHS